MKCSVQSTPYPSQCDGVEQYNGRTEPNKIDALLSVEVISSSKETSYVQIGNVFSPVSSPQISFEIILKDVKSGKIAFKLTANSEGDSMSAISKSLAEKIVEIYMAELFDDSGVFE